jgi:hypothetical protein
MPQLHEVAVAVPRPKAWPRLLALRRGIGGVGGGAVAAAPADFVERHLALHGGRIAVITASFPCARRPATPVSQFSVLAPHRQAAPHGPAGSPPTSAGCRQGMAAPARSRAAVSSSSSPPQHAGTDGCGNHQQQPGCVRGRARGGCRTEPPAPLCVAWLSTTEQRRSALTSGLLRAVPPAPCERGVVVS